MDNSVCLLAVCATAKADGIGTTVTGALNFAGSGQKNFFSPDSLTIGAGEVFHFDNGEVQLDASFTGSTLTITNDYNGFGVAPITESFTDTGFTGFTTVGTLPPGFGYTSSGDTITYTAPSNGPNEVITINFTTASPTPEPSSFVLLGTAILGSVSMARRRFAQRQDQPQQNRV